MELKKTPKADLQSRKTLFLEIGLAVSLLVVLFAFNWTSKEKPEATLVAARQEIIEEEESVPITQQEPPPVQDIPQVLMVPDEIVIVDDDIKIDTDFDFSESETTENLFSDLKYVDKPQVIKEEEVLEETVPFLIVENKPKFQGKDANDFGKWVTSKVVYPPAAEENNIQGTVLISFVVNTDGTLSDIKSIRRVDPLLEEEAIRVVKLSPKWTPGSQQNKKVKVPYQVPIQFTIQN